MSFSLGIFHSFPKFSRYSSGTIMQNLILGSMLSEYITSNTDCLCSAKLARAKLDSLPRFDILATVSNVPHLSDLDPDLQIPSQTNFKYY